MTVPSEFWAFEYLVLSWWHRLRRIRTHKLVGRNAVLGAGFEVSKAIPSSTSLHFLVVVQDVNSQHFLLSQRPFKIRFHPFCKSRKLGLN